MGYVLASQNHVIDTDTFKIVSLDEIGDANIDCLMAMWSLWSDLRLHAFRLFWHDFIKLNGFEVHISPLTRNDGIPVFGWHSCDILFPGKFPLKLTISPKFNYMGYLTDARSLREVAYLFEHKGESNTYKTAFSGIGTHYEYVDDLAMMRDSEHTVPEYLSVGISPKQYQVIYRQRGLQGKTYALLLGSYAILLGDDMSYDSLVTLVGVSETLQHEPLLMVNRILHTDNPYVFKAQFLMK